jgi:hypothetical protein
MEMEIRLASSYGKTSLATTTRTTSPGGTFNPISPFSDITQRDRALSREEKMRFAIAMAVKRESGL